MKIKEITASFSMKKSLGNYEMADIFFSANAQVMGKNKPEKVAEQVHDFVKRLAVAKYNSFSRSDLTGTPSTVEYEKGFRAGYKEAVNPTSKYGKDPDEKKETMAEAQMDAKSENTLDPY